jgi:DEAD/DEAH box helicase domain-containing protein
VSQIDALKMVEHVRERLVDLAVAENYIRDKQVSDAVQRVWEGPGHEGGLVSELWVEGAFPGELTGDSIKSLSSDELFPEDLCRHIDLRKIFPVDRKLFNHQSEILKDIAVTVHGKRKSYILTAGTGLGKTEAFLLPMLHDLWTAPERRRDGGMRCLILYPMNALVADQVERIYKWLQGQDRITVFHFTSETPEIPGGLTSMVKRDGTHAEFEQGKKHAAKRHMTEIEYLSNHGEMCLI